MVINHSEDTRYHESMLSTHDKCMIPCSQLSSFDGIINSTDSELLNKVMECDVVLINEGQFFGSLSLFVRFLLKHCKMGIYAHLKLFTLNFSIHFFCLCPVWGY
jgi:thymidine kinase